MAYQQISGGGLEMPGAPLYRIPTGGSTSLTASTIDATGEKFAFNGQVWFPARTGSKSIRNVGFRFGAVTKAGGSGLTVSLQDVSSSTGRIQPDEIQDQTVAIANGNASFASNTWIETGNLSADRSVAFGEWLSVVIEYDGSGRLGADSVVLNSLTPQFNAPMQSGPSLKTASWTPAGSLNNLALKFSDGTYGTLGIPNQTGYALTADGLHTFNSGSTPDEYALKINNPFPCKVDGGWFFGGPSNSDAADWDIVLYEGTSAIATAAQIAERTTSLNTARYISFVFDAEYELDANTDYYLAFKPTSTTNCYVVYMDVHDAAMLDIYPGGQNYCQASRTDAGSWSATTTRRLYAGLTVSSISGGAGGGSLNPLTSIYGKV